MNTADIKRVIEAVLLCAQQPMPVAELRKLFSDEVEIGADTLRALLDELRADWQGRGVELVPLATGWRFQSTPDIARFVTKLQPERAPKYSRAVLETLAIVAYRQPVTRGDIEEIRGVAVSAQIVKTLEDRGWIEVIGHKDVVGRPALFATTKQFLDDLGLRSIQELPSLDDAPAAAAFEQKIQALGDGTAEPAVALVQVMGEAGQALDGDAPAVAANDAEPDASATPDTPAAFDPPAAMDPPGVPDAHPSASAAESAPADAAEPGPDLDAAPAADVLPPPESQSVPGADVSESSAPPPRSVSDLRPDL